MNGGNGFAQEKTIPMNVDVSVVMPTFNRAHLIGESIESALHQSLEPREVIVVDDGSNDGTSDVVRGFGARVTYLRQDNAGKSAALNRGIAATTGDWLLVLDDDDLLPPDALQAHAAALQASPQAAFSYGRFVRFRGEGADAHLSSDLEEIPGPDDRRLIVRLMERCFLPNPAWMVRRDAQLEAGPYREDLHRGQDYEMILRLARANCGCFTDCVTLYQRKHVSERRSQGRRVVTQDTIAGWIGAEQAIFRHIDETWRDADFLPWDVEPDDDCAVRLAVLQRGVVMFMRKLYDRSELHLRRYAATLGEREPDARELRLAAGLLGSRYGLDDLLERGEQVAWLRSLDLPRQIHIAMASQLPWRLKNLLLQGRIVQARKLFQLGHETFGAAAMAGAIGNRLRFPVARAAG